MDMIMKRVFRTFFAAAAIASLASCAEKLAGDINSEAASDTSGLVSMTFSASMCEDVDVKTTYRSRNVYWEQNDAITVFSVGDQVVKESFTAATVSEDKTKATFSGLADAAAAAYVAVYPHSEANVYTDGVLTVNIPAEQTAVAGGFQSGANVSVAVSAKDGESDLQFKNVGALLAFTFGNDNEALNTRSVTIKARKSDTEYWGLTGAASVIIGEDNLPAASEGTETYVTVNAPEEGFRKSVLYYVPVLPVGDCVGMELIYTDLNGAEYVKKNDIDFRLLRSYMFNVGALPSQTFAVPEDFSFTVDFTSGWPFVTPLVEEQTTTAYSYYYKAVYTSGGKEYVTYLPIKVKAGVEGKEYYMDSNGLFFKTENKDDIYSPAIAGRYCTCIDVDKTAAGKLNIEGMTSSGWNLTDITFDIYADKTICSYGAEVSVLAAMDKSYRVRIRNSTTIKRITFTYSATNPGNAPAE